MYKHIVCVASMNTQAKDVVTLLLCCAVETTQDVIWPGSNGSQSRNQHTYMHAHAHTHTQPGVYKLASGTHMYL